MKKALNFLTLLIFLIIFLGEATYATGNFKVISDIKNVDIYIDGTWAGNTSINIAKMPPGRHKVRLEKNKAAIWEGTFNLIDRGKTTVHITKDIKIKVKESPMSEESLQGVIVLDVSGGYISYNTSDVTLKNKFQGGPLYNLNLKYGLTRTTLAALRLNYLSSENQGAKIMAASIGLNLEYFFYREEHLQLYVSGGANYISTTLTDSNAKTYNGAAAGGSLYLGGEYLFLNRLSAYLEGGYRINRVNNLTAGDGSTQTIDLSGPNGLAGVRYYF